MSTSQTKDAASLSSYGKKYQLCLKVIKTRGQTIQKRHRRWKTEGYQTDIKNNWLSEIAIGDKEPFICREGKPFGVFAIWNAETHAMWCKVQKFIMSALQKYALLHPRLSLMESSVGSCVLGIYLTLKMKTWVQLMVSWAKSVMGCWKKWRVPGTKEWKWETRRRQNN